MIIKNITVVITAYCVFGTDVAVAFNGTTRTDWDSIGYPLLIVFLLLQWLYYRLTDRLADKKKYRNQHTETRRRAEQGSATAQFELAKEYQEGIVVAKDETQAVFWYQKAAEQGYAKAQNNLGYLYEVGKGIVKDGAEAAYWYQKAAEQGLSSAQYNLGVMYEKGKGIAKDETQAVFWYQKAAEQGNEDAQEDLRRLGQSIF